jgi:hypothetical protein
MLQYFQCHGLVLHKAVALNQFLSDEKAKLQKLAFRIGIAHAEV